MRGAGGCACRLAARCLRIHRLCLAACVLPGLPPIVFSGAEFIATPIFSSCPCLKPLSSFPD